MLLLKKILNDGFVPYKYSFKYISERTALCILKKGTDKFVCLKHNEKLLFTETVKEYREENSYTSVFRLNWHNFQLLKKITDITPKSANQSLSLSFDDGFGNSVCAFLKNIHKNNIFPVIAQTEKTYNSESIYKNTMIKSVLSVLETGYTGNWGMNAYNITSKNDLAEAADAEFSMYTVNISPFILSDIHISENYDNLKTNLNNYTEKTIELYKKNYHILSSQFNITEDNIYYSSVRFEKALEIATEYYNTVRDRIKDFDFEIDLKDSVSKTSYSDCFYIISYLIMNNVNINLFSPKLYFDENSENKKTLASFAELMNRFSTCRLSLSENSTKSFAKTLKTASDSNWHIRLAQSPKQYLSEFISKYDKNLSETILNHAYNTDYKNISDKINNITISNETEFYHFLDRNIKKIISV